ncbi:MAG: hypothetical protein GY801_30795, partial [bacterium]|nr:hypothetical protein [bacterium]
MKGFIKKSAVFMLIFSLFLMLSGSTEAQTKITLWTLFGGGEGYIMTNLVEQFNAEHPDIVLEEQIIEWDQYYNKLMTGLLADEAPNVGIMHLAVLPD